MGGPVEQEVREEDQQRINNFNKLNTRLHELQAGLKVKKARATSQDTRSSDEWSTFRSQALLATQIKGVNMVLQAELEDLGDASNELMLLDEDQV